MKTLIYPRKSTDGMSVLYCRLVHTGRRETFSTSIKIDTKNWNHAKQVITGSTAELKRAKLSLERLKGRIQREEDNLRFEGNFSLRKLKNVLIGRDDDTVMFLEEFENFIKLQKSRQSDPPRSRESDPLRSRESDPLRSRESDPPGSRESDPPVHNFSS